MLKLYAWEPSFEKQIIDVRRKEVNILRITAYYNALMSFLFTSTPFLVRKNYTTLKGKMEPFGLKSWVIVWPKKFNHFGRKSWITGGTKIQPGILSNWRIFESNWILIESLFYSYIILQLLGVIGEYLNQIESLSRVNFTHILFSNYSESRVKY